MQVVQITFSVERTLPLQPITRDPNDQYANIKPCASCTVEVTADPTTKAGKTQIQAAYTAAQNACVTQMSNFYDEIVSAFKQ